MTPTLRDDRTAFFAAASLDDSAYDGRWLSFVLGPLEVHYPMTAGMRAALPLHDLHHVITGYGADAVGEAEIAAWELASGCGSHLDAWYGNLAFAALGVSIAPRRTFRAFIRGTRSSNLYGRAETMDTLLDRATPELCAELRQTEVEAARVRDVVLFGLMLPFAALAGASFLLATPWLALAKRVGA